MPHGIEILLVVGTPLPAFIHEMRGPRVQTSYETYLSRRVLALRIVGAEAGFIPGGQVSVKTSKNVDGRVAFERNTVFEIRKLPLATGSATTRNRCLCVKCVEFSGEGEDIPGKYNIMKFTCFCCGETWES